MFALVRLPHRKDKVWAEIIVRYEKTRGRFVIVFYGTEPINKTVFPVKPRLKILHRSVSCYESEVIQILNFITPIVSSTGQAA